MLRILAFLTLGLLLEPGVATAQPRILEVDISDLDDDQLDFLTGWDRDNEVILDISGLGVTRYRLAAELVARSRTDRRPKRFRRPARSEPLGMSRRTGARPRVHLRPPDPRVRIPRFRPR